MQIFIYCKATLHVSGVTAPIIRSIKNCTRSLRYRSYYLYCYSPTTWSDRDGEWKWKRGMEKSDESRTRRNEQRRKYSKWIKGQRISWLGHLERMEEDRMPKKIFTEEREGTRRRGRPRKRWKEEVERDLHVLGVRRWREMVADRKKRKDIFRQAKAHSGL